MPEEMVGIGFGYLVQLILYLSEKLEIVLPYKMKFCGSHSTIHSLNFPLYYEDHSLKELGFGVKLFNLNISYLCFTQGILLKEEELSQNIFNVYRCLDSSSFGRFFFFFFSFIPFQLIFKQIN